MSVQPQEFELPFQWESNGFISPFVCSSDASLTNLTQYLLSSSEPTTEKPFATPPPGSKMVDLGCGNGKVLRAMCPCLKWSGLGVDLDERLVEDAVRMNAEVRLPEGINLIARQADLTDSDQFEASVKDCTVIFTYLLTDALDDLKDVMLKVLKKCPEVRIVITNWFPIKYLVPSGLGFAETKFEDFRIYHR
eukprot:PhF_6_TR12484/c0_g1_i1/m.19620